MNRLAYILLLFTLVIFVNKSASAQWLETGFMVGTSNYMGDLVEQHMAPQEYNTAFGVFGRYQMSKFISFKVYANKLELSGADANNSARGGLRQRNLSFKTNVVELGFTNEISITPYSPRDNKNALPYIFVGVSGFYYNPQAEFKGNFYDLRPLGTEGQGNVLSGSKPYSSIAFAVPFGFGFKWNINPLINLGAEFGMRITTTDYLDDVSGKYPNLELLAEQDPLAATLSYRAGEYGPSLNFADAKGTTRGNPDNADWYFIAGISLSINLTDAYGLEWNKEFRSFSDEPVPEKGKFKVRTNKKKRKK